ncbi:MAG TPA: metallophosphoesterase [Actinomycetota bacterium]|nr:metallophosphoesterase [Actinomycetota bacterium]
MIRLAAVGDLHAGVDSIGKIAPRFEDLPERADVLLLAGDLTRLGEPEEGKVLAEELRSIEIPVVTVLGNHDYHSGRQDDIRGMLEDVGVHVLEGEAAVLDVGGVRLGVAGTKGFGGGFPGASATAFGEDVMKAFVGHTEDVSERLEQALRELKAELRVVLLHYAPIEATLSGERLEIYPFLGSYLLAEAIDRAGADAVFHGHAHRGTEKGVTPGGIHVRNVAETVIGHAYQVYRLGNGVGPER